MSRKFLTAIDLTKNEIQNAVAQNLAGAPAAPVKGQFYFNSTDNVLYWWDGTQWVPAKDAGGSGFPGYAPAGSTVAETTFGQAKADGVATTVARADHTHGSPTHTAADHSTIPLNSFAPPTGPVNMGGWTIQNVGNPTNPTDAANKQYVDGAIAGLSWKDAVRAASTANVATTPAPATIDGVTLAAGDRVLLKDQTSPQANGIYTLTGANFVRAQDANTSDELLNAAVFVSEGTTNADTAWVGTADLPIVVDTTPLPFVKFAGGAPAIADGDKGDITVSNSGATWTIDPNVVTNTKLADMPALTLKGNDTGAAGDPKDLNLPAVVGMFGGLLMRKVVNVTTAGTTTVMTHSLGTQDITVTVYRVATPFDEVDCDIEHTTSNTVTLRFAVAVAAGEYRIVVSG